MPVQLQNVRLITDKTIADVLSSGVFAILISVTQTKKNTKFISVPQISLKRGNCGVTKKVLNCAASSQLQLTALLTPLVSSGVLFFDQKQVSLNPALAPHQSGFQFLNPARSGALPDLK